VSIRQLSSREVYRSRWMRVREDQVAFADGSPGVFSVVEKIDFALAIPLDDGHVHMVSQYRYAAGRRSLEFPQGSCPEAPDATPEAIARTELAEETGFAAQRMECLGLLHPAVGYATNRFHVFLATGLTPGPVSREPSEQDMTQHRVPLPELERLIRDGEIVDAHTVAAWGLYLLRR
jgi:8-oxo-dGTP pyrophosphatase MutT (NUDIX family)